MAGYGNTSQDYWAPPPPGPQQQQHHQQQQSHGNSFNFEMPEQFGQELHYQPFEATPANGAGSIPSNSFYDPNVQYAGGMFQPSETQYYGDGGEGDEFENEPPLLEELGINPSHIFQKTLSVLNPFRTTDQSILQDTDMAGPLVFVLALGGFLLLSGKVTFSYIYGIGVLGCLAFYALLSLMATTSTVTVGAVVSVLGYCLLPMVVLSGINVLITIQGATGTVFAGLSILWCALSASKLFVTAYSMEHQQMLIAYPCALLYGVFALITVF